MKKNVCVFVMFVVMALCVMFPNESHAATTETGMLKDLLTYINGHEKMYSDILWALEYIEKFDRERSWENLQLARASVSIAAFHIQNYKFPEPVMTMEDMRKLMKRKIDVSLLSNADEMFKANQNLLNTSCLNLKYFLMCDVFLQESWSICRRDVENLKGYAKLIFQRLAIEADAVLVRLNSPADAKTFNSTLKKICPQTYAHIRKDHATIEEIEASQVGIIEKLEKDHMENTKIIGAFRNNLNASKHGQQEKPLKISNVPPLIYMPDWWNSQNCDISYFWKDSNGKLEIPDSRSKLTRVPDGCVIQISGVSLEQVKAYQNQLAKDGLRCLGNKDGGSKFFLLYRLKNSSFSMLWENNTVIIHMDENPVCFMPRSSLLIWKEAGLMR